MKLVILDSRTLQETLHRLAHEIREGNPGESDLVLVGIQRGGIVVAQRLAEILSELMGRSIACGVVDVSFHRDDLDRRAIPVVYSTEIPGDINGRTVVLVDDVLFTGRTIRAALDALHDFGRPSSVQLAVLIDRGHRELPIKADFVGKKIATSRAQTVEVQLMESDGVDAVQLCGTEV